MKGNLSPATLLAARRSERLVREAHDEDPSAAESLYRQALAEADRSGRPGAVAQAAQGLYFLLQRQGRYPEAAIALERTVDAHRRRDGADGRWTAEWRNELISLYGRLSRCDALDTGCGSRLEVACRDRLASDVRLHGTASLEAAWALITLGWALRVGERWDESEGRYRQALDLIEGCCGADHPRTGWALAGLSLVRQHHGDVAGAEATLRRAGDNWDRVGHLDRSTAVIEMLVDLYVGEGRDEDALALSCAWLDRVRRRACLADEREAVRLECHAALLRRLGRDLEAPSYEHRASSARGRLEARERAGPIAPGSGQREPDLPAAPGAAQWIAGPVFPSPLL